MFAVVKTGAKQYKVAAGDVIKVEKLDGEAGTTVTLDHVLMIGDENGVTVGTPMITGTPVTAEILEQARSEKIIIFKKRRRQNSRRKNGHRQSLTVLRILQIGSQATPKAAPKATKKASAPVEVAPEAAAEPKKPAAKKAPKTTTKTTKE